MSQGEKKQTYTKKNGSEKKGKCHEQNKTYVYENIIIYLYECVEPINKKPARKHKKINTHVQEIQSNI